MLGDDVPADELDHLTRPGQDFGFPYCHQGDLADPQFGREHGCARIHAAGAQARRPCRVAWHALLYRGARSRAAYRGNIFIAEHGSWNRSSKVGYRVTRVVLDAGRRATRYEPFVEGWLQGESAWGRPADVLPLPDGSLLVSDDAAGAIYRIRYAP